MKRVLKQITEEYISQCYSDKYKAIYDDVIEYAYNYFCESYCEYLSQFTSQYNEIVKSMGEIKEKLEKVNQYVSSVGTQFEKVTSSQFLFVENCSAQQKYDYQLNALKYPYDIYYVYKFDEISSKVDEYDEKLTNIILGKNKNYFLIVKKFNISSTCIDEILKINDKYSVTQWQEVTSSDKTFFFEKGVMSVISSIIHKYGGEFSIVDEELYYIFAISNLVTISESDVNIYGETKDIVVAQKLSNAFASSNLINKTESSGKYSDLLECREIANFKLKIEKRILEPIKETAKKIDKNISDYYSKKSKKRDKITFAAFIVLFAVIISTLLVGFKISGVSESFVFFNYLQLILIGAALSFILLLPLIIVYYIKGKSEKRNMLKLSDCNLACAQTLYNETCKNYYENGAGLVSSKLYIDYSEKDNKLIDSCSKIKDILSTYIKYRDDVQKYIKATTKYLPAIFDGKIRLLGDTYKQMKSGLAQEYQTAMFQAQQAMRQEELEYERKRREYERQRNEEKERRELLESQKRVEEYAKEQAEQARKQASAAQEQAEYYRQMRDAQRENSKYAEQQAESAKKQADEAKKQRELQEEQKRMLEEEIRRNRGY